MPNNKKYVSVLNDGSQDLYVKDAEAREQIQENIITPETDGAIDTLFDTHYDSTNKAIVFGDECAKYDEERNALIIEGAVSDGALIIS